MKDKYSKEKLQPDGEIIIPQDDLYTIPWEAHFDYQVFEPRQDDNSNTANIDNVIYDNVDDDAVEPRPASSRDGLTNEMQMTSPKQMAEATRMNARPHTATSRDAIILYDEDDVNENAAKEERRSVIEKPDSATSRDNQNIGDTPIDSRNGFDEGTSYSLKRREDNPVPGLSDNGKNIF